MKPARKPYRVEHIQAVIDEWRRKAPGLEMQTIALEHYLALRSKVRELINKQAEDEGLWFVARTAPEAYLQQELRRLHAELEAMVSDDE